MLSKKASTSPGEQTAADKRLAEIDGPELRGGLLCLCLPWQSYDTVELVCGLYVREVCFKIFNCESPTRSPKPNVIAGVNFLKLDICILSVVNNIQRPGYFGCLYGLSFCAICARV